MIVKPEHAMVEETYLDEDHYNKAYRPLRVRLSPHV